MTQTADVGDFIGMPVYDPLVRQVYFGNPKDGTYQHGLLAFKVGSDCTLSLAWQKPIGFNLPNPAGNPMIPAIVAGGFVYYSTGSASSIYVYDSMGNHLWDSGTQIRGGIFASPMVANGLLVVGDYKGNITAFGP